MTTKKKIIIALIVIGVIALITWFIYSKKKTSPISEEAPVSASFPLKMGSKGKEVEALQKYLNDKYSAGLEVDGIWGEKTDAAVQTSLMRDNISEAVYTKWALGN